ncbi:hypothetical protein JZ751_013955 [Albula glossodonta]|uniref:Uncharacterized protein n=1 Tax=Albula glossodonta TaxID=121402 RepID=A0A8T2MJA5_9TELE|nr:hypothetical protein JZ751_013955 [Albula glossodonta]
MPLRTRLAAHSTATPQDGQRALHSWVVLAAEIKQHCPDRLEHLGCSRTEGAVIRNLEGIPTLGD